MNEQEIFFILTLLQERLLDLVFAPLQNHEMLWSAIPLAIATLFMTLYFGRHKTEWLSWNDAFGNTMVFLFVALNLIREMYESGPGDWAGLFANPLYLGFSLLLASGSFLLMTITYFHLLPKKLALFIFSTGPINVSVYVVMAMIYADVPPDILTLLAGLAFLLVILVAMKMLMFTVRAIGLGEEGEEEDEKSLAEKVEFELEERRRRKRQSEVNPKASPARRRP
ncbi:MAG: hypothetical protein V1827_04880 [Candidatus Micrarchaeota archaeon]